MTEVALHRWTDIVRSYFFSVISISILTITVFILLLLCYAQDFLEHYSYRMCILTETAYSLILYFSMIAIIISVNQKKFSFLGIIKKIWHITRLSWIVFMMKIAWNMIHMYVMGFDYTPNPNSILLVPLLLFSAWIVLVFLASYIISRSLLDNRVWHFSWTTFLEYIRNIFLKSILFLILSILTASVFIFIMAGLLSVITPVLKNHFAALEIKTISEYILHIAFSTVFAHLFAISIFSSYQKFHLKNKPKK